MMPSADLELWPKLLDATNYRAVQSNPSLFHSTPNTLFSVLAAYTLDIRDSIGTIR
jgi:hypothetical protein